MEFDVDFLNKILNDKTVNSTTDISKKYSVSDRMAGYYWFIARNFDGIAEMFENDNELVETNVRYKKQQQRFADLNRVERKSFREHARVENAVSEYAKALVDVFESNPYKPQIINHKSTGMATGVLQISDAHFNELIDIGTNKYDFCIASTRIYKFVQEAKRYFTLHGVSDVFLFFTGDLVNSDRRLDELVSMATNRGKATFIAVQILEHAILDLNSDFNVHVAGVCGNESRVGKDYKWSNELVSDNYDFTIFNTLRYKLSGSGGISFLGLSDKHEEVIRVGNSNFLIIHGHQLGKDLSKDISKLIRKYIHRDIDIDFVLFGHIHESLISDYYARSASVCGSNNYSEDSLLLVSKASQNIHIVYPDRIDSVKIDLQNTDGYEGYDVKVWQDAYNPKSVEKARKKETILKITI